MNNIRFGIGITTYNNTDLRHRISCESIKWITAKCPLDSEIVIVDDASRLKTDYTSVDYNGKIKVIRNETNLGVAKSKNKCLEYLMNQGCTDIFLFDDDCWIQDAKYYYEYAYQDLPHMNPYPIEHINNPKKIFSKFIYKGQKYIEAFPYGSCLYFQREIIEEIGGFNILLSHFGEEHSEIEERIYKAEYTPKSSFDFYRPNGNYPVIIHPSTFNSQASSMTKMDKIKNIREAQAKRKLYGGLKCPYREADYSDFLSNHIK